MNAIVDRLWAEIEPFAYITREQFTRGLEAWEIEPVEIDGASFVMLRQGPEFHIAIGEGRPITASMIRASIAPSLERFGCVTTSTPKDDVRQRRANERFGFVPTSESEFFIHYRLDNKCR